MSQRTYSLPTVIFADYIMPLIRLVFLPVILVHVFVTVFRASMQDETAWVTKSVLKQIKVPIDKGPDATEAAINEKVGDLLAKDDLKGIADWLVTEEEDIDETRGGLRSYQMILEAALANETLELIEDGELDPPNSLEKVVLPFEEAFAAHPTHHGLAALTAFRHMQAGWAFRGCGFVYEITDKQWQKVEEHYSRAAEILRAFDAEELQSPSLAQAVHKLLAIEGSSGKLDAAFEVWRKMDPMGSRAFMRHAFHSLPRWGGSYEKILLDARRLASETSETWGMAAYPLYLIQLCDCEPEIFEHMDIELFEEGVHDLLQRRSEPRVVNFWLRELNFLAAAQKVRGDDSEGEARVRDLARRLRSDLIRNHLTRIDLATWENEPFQPLALIATEFKEDVQAGRLVVVGAKGRLTVETPPST